MPTIEQELARLAATAPADDPAADTLAANALRRGNRSRRIRFGATVGGTCAAVVAAGTFAMALPWAPGTAVPAGGPTPDVKESGAGPRWGGTSVDPVVFRRAVTALVPGSHPTATDPADGTMSGPEGWVAYAERHDKTWNAEISLAVYPKGSASGSGDCKDYSKPFRCTETRVPGGLLGQASVPRTTGKGVVTPFTWLVRDDGTTIVMALTGPETDVDKSTLTAKQAVTIVTSPLWDHVIRG